MWVRREKRTPRNLPFSCTCPDNIDVTWFRGSFSCIVTDSLDRIIYVVVSVTPFHFIAMDRNYADFDGTSGIIRLYLYTLKFCCLRYIVWHYYALPVKCEIALSLLWNHTLLIIWQHQTELRNGLGTISMICNRSHDNVIGQVLIEFHIWYNSEILHEYYT